MNRRLTTESTPVDQGHYFAFLTGTYDREEISEVSDISTENPAVAGSPTDKTMMYGVTKKAATSSSFTERLKNTLGNFFAFNMRTRTGDEVDTQEEEEEK